MTIRLRLILWYCTVSLAIVLFFSLLTYLGMKRLLFNALDDELVLLSDTIERTYNPFLDEFTDLNDLFAKPTGRQIFYLVVYDATGSPVFSTLIAKKIKLNIPLHSDARMKGYTLKIKIPDHSSLPTDGHDEIRLRAIAHQLYFQNRRIGWAVIGQSVEHIEDSMQHLLTVLFFGIIVTVVVSAVGGYFLTRKALHPINTITKKAKQISQSSLSQRIDLHNKNDELGRLTMVLNSLLERLQKAFVSQQQFLADAAHELKTPLSILRAHWESEINNPKVSLEMKGRLVEDIETITRLNHLINNLLLLAQTEALQTNFEFVPLQLDELLQDVVADAQILAEMKSQNIVQQELAEAQIKGDRNYLYQLFFNILDNASKYTPQNGKIDMSLSVQEQWAVVMIRDNGVGISPEHLKHIFERFYRVDKDRARKTGGSGLGLAICKLVAEAHDGAIEVESKLGRGTQFVVKLPLMYRAHAVGLSTKAEGRTTRQDIKVEQRT